MPSAASPMFPFVMQEKRLIGSVYGSGRPTETSAAGRLAPRGAAEAEGAGQPDRIRSNRSTTRLAALAGAEGARGVILR